MSEEVLPQTPEAASGAFGRTIADAFYVSDAPAVVTRTSRQALVAVTELASDRNGVGLTAPLPADDAYILAVQLRDFHGELWIDGAKVNVPRLRPGATTLYDVRRETIAYLGTAFHCLQFYVSQSALQEVVETSSQSLANLQQGLLGLPVDEPIFANFANMMLPVLADPTRYSNLFTDHMSLAFVHQFVHSFGLSRADSVVRNGGLTPRQERRAKDVLTARLTENPALRDVADACGLSLSHFARAFKQTVGQTPHAWLRAYRVEYCKTLLKGDYSLLEISEICGFADQSHMSRVFKGEVGVGPAAWRRDHR